MKHIEAVIFDWAGTTVDYGCMAPMQAMQKAFAEENIAVTLDEIREPMGLLKLDHINAILAMTRVKHHFEEGKHRAPTQQDSANIYAQFEKNIMANLHEHTRLIDGILDVQTTLRQQNIKIGSTTGYTKDMIQLVASSAKEQGYAPDFVISADQVSRGRPYPYMMHQNMMALHLQDARQVVKVGDTLVDILEGLHAGCWSIGVMQGSSMMGLTEAEVAALSPEIVQRKYQQVRADMLAAGAHAVIHSIRELPTVLSSLTQKMQKVSHDGR